MINVYDKFLNVNHALTPGKLFAGLSALALIVGGTLVGMELYDGYFESQAAVNEATAQFKTPEEGAYSDGITSLVNDANQTEGGVLENTYDAKISLEESEKALDELLEADYNYTYSEDGTTITVADADGKKVATITSLDNDPTLTPENPGPLASFAENEETFNTAVKDFDTKTDVYNTESDKLATEYAKRVNNTLGHEPSGEQIEDAKEVIIPVMEEISVKTEGNVETFSHTAPPTGGSTDAIKTNEVEHKAYRESADTITALKATDAYKNLSPSEQEKSVSTVNQEGFDLGNLFQQTGEVITDKLGKDGDMITKVAAGTAGVGLLGTVAGVVARKASEKREAGSSQVGYTSSRSNSNAQGQHVVNSPMNMNNSMGNYNTRQNQ